MKKNTLLAGFVLCLFALAVSEWGCLGDDPNAVENNGNDDSDNGSGDSDGDSDADGDSDIECNPDGEPTWEDPINNIMQEEGCDCHDQVKSYDSIMEWVDNGLLEEYAKKGSDHYLNDEQNQKDVLRWIDIGAPETDCEVSAKE